MLRGKLSILIDENANIESEQGILPIQKDLKRMPIFTIVYNDNSTKKTIAESKEDLIRNFSLNDPTSFQEDVKEIRWEEDNYCCVECISSGKISKSSTVEDN